MLSVKISDVKLFMNKFLGTEMFDHFLVPNATVNTFVTHHIDGHIQLDFFSDENPDKELLAGDPYIPFSNIRQYCFEIMKGKRSPLSFKFVFMLSKENQSRTLSSLKSSFSSDDITGMFINLNYQNKQLLCTTGISYRTFTLDKSLESEWERLVTVFLKNNQIICESL